LTISTSSYFVYSTHKRTHSISFIKFNLTNNCRFQINENRSRYICTTLKLNKFLIISNRFTHIFQRQSQQKMFEMNHQSNPSHILLAFVHQVECHVQDNTIPNKHYQFVRHIDQYVSIDIHAKFLDHNFR